MVGVDKKKITDVLKKKEEAKKVTAAPATSAKKYNPTSGTVGAPTGTQAGVKSAEQKLKETQAAREFADKKKQEEILRTKTHQDLINAAYKAGEKLGISPWAILVEEWSNFTNTRGDKYKGPIIDDLKHLNDEQKKVLKEVLGI